MDLPLLILLLDLLLLRGELSLEALLLLEGGLRRRWRVLQSGLELLHAIRRRQLLQTQRTGTAKVRAGVVALEADLVIDQSSWSVVIVGNGEKRMRVRGK